MSEGTPLRGFILGFAAVGILYLAIGVWAVFEGHFPTEHILERHPDPNDPFWWDNQVVIPIFSLSGFGYLYLSRCLAKGRHSQNLWRFGCGMLMLGLLSKLLMIITIIALYKWWRLRPHFPMRSSQAPASR